MYRYADLSPVECLLHRIPSIRPNTINPMSMTHIVQYTSSIPIIYSYITSDDSQYRQTHSFQYFSIVDYYQYSASKLSISSSYTSANDYHGVGHLFVRNQNLSLYRRMFPIPGRLKVDSSPTHSCTFKSRVQNIEMRIAVVNGTGRKLSTRARTFSIQDNDPEMIFFSVAEQTTVEGITSIITNGMKAAVARSEICLLKICRH